ncbi:uncharacterized protein [Henckelia pumila]|uniref:uncharacterized protein isoform X2 n=1 Tax=Henckelia pumila TaxID=405737 RepID=UPI003C6E0AC0
MDVAYQVVSERVIVGVALDEKFDSTLEHAVDRGTECRDDVFDEFGDLLELEYGGDDVNIGDGIGGGLENICADIAVVKAVQVIEHISGDAPVVHAPKKRGPDRPPKRTRSVPGLRIKGFCGVQNLMQLKLIGLHLPAG